MADGRAAGAFVDVPLRPGAAAVGEARAQLPEHDARRVERVLRGLEPAVPLVDEHELEDARKASADESCVLRAAAAHAAELVAKDEALAALAAAADAARASGVQLADGERVFAYAPEEMTLRVVRKSMKENKGVEAQARASAERLLATLATLGGVALRRTS
jgi:hypothetical protein